MADINDIKNRTVSHGTLNPDHLIPVFCDVLKEYAPDKYAEFIKDYPELDGWEDFLEADWRIVSDDTKVNACDDLFGLLNDIAPEGTMFSSTEGDGSDFGFWTVEEKKEESKDITTLTDLKKFILSKNDNSVVFGVNSTGDLYFVDSVNGKEVPASADSLAVAEDDSDEHGKRIGNQGTGYFVVWKNGKRPTYMTAQQIYDELLKIARSWTVEEKLLDDDEGEKALKKLQGSLSQYKGKTTGQIAADVRYDVATALDVAADKAEDLMTKFGLDKIYVLRAKGLSPKAIAKKILKACESKDEATRYYGYGKDDAIDKEDNDFMWQVAYDWFVDKLPEKLARYADKAVTAVIDKDSQAYEEIMTMDDYYDYLKKYGPSVVNQIKVDMSEAREGDNWVAYYFCEDPQGLEWAVLPHAINGIGNASCVNARGGNDTIGIEFVLDECTPIEDVKGSGIYGKVKELEDRDIVALTRDEAERIALADDRLKELKAIVSPKDESKSEDTGVAAIYGDGDVSTHENSADGFYVDEHDPMGFAVLNNDTATMKELFSGKAVAPEKPWTYAGWHEDINAPENKDGSYPYVYDWEREYDLNFVNDWKRVVGDKNNEKALELLLQYAPDFIPSAMDFWNAFHAGYSKGLLRKLFDNIFAVVDKDDPDNNYLGYGDYTYDEVAKFLEGKDEAADSRRVDDYANMRFFDPEEFVKYVRKAYGKDGGYVSIDSVVPVSVLNKANRMAQANGYKKMESNKPISCNALVAALQETGFDVKEDLNGSYRIVAKGDDFDTTDNLLFITTLYPESTSDRDFVSDSAFVRGRVNGNRIVATDLKSVEDIVSVCVNAFGKKTETKNESLTLKQKELKDMARYGEAEDITTISDAEAKELKKKGIETVGVSRGTYGMNGALLRDREGNKYVITARSSNLFYFV